MSDELLKWALKSEAAPRIAAMVTLAASEPGVPVLPEELNRHPWLLNVPNGTLELRTGTLREHRREDMLTQLCPTPFDLTAKCPLWLAVLDKIFAGKAQLIPYVRKLLGRCLTGDVTEQSLFVFWGEGANGKSTLINAVLEVLGEDYAIKASRDLFLARKTDNHPTQLARLHGKRLVVCTETPQDARLDETLVKELTGGDPITARRMREDPWQFLPTHKAILVTNHKPEVRGTDDGIWRRQRLIPFTVRIADHEQDKNLAEKLRAEYPGILAWMVSGCLDWQREGLEPPECVLQAVKDYRDEQDLLARFIEECCIVEESEKVRAGVFYERFRRWCGGKAPSQTWVGKEMPKRGYGKHTSHGVWYLGVGLPEPPQPPAAESAPEAGATGAPSQEPAPIQEPNGFW